MDADVIVVGAGPVGMTAAAMLHRAGVSVRVLEREPERSPFSRAVGVHPRTLEVLDGLTAPDGVTVADRMVGAGLPLPATHFATLPAQVRYEPLDTPYPFLLALPQPTTERFLAEYLASRGVPVETGCDVVDVQQDDRAVRAGLADGRELSGRALVGADGAHSVVRHRAGIGFPGTPAGTIGVVADVRLTHPPQRPYHWDPELGTVNVLATPEGRYRVFGQDPAWAGLTEQQARDRQREPVRRAEIDDLLTRLTGRDCGLSDVLWTARVSDVFRRADTLRSGRVLLAGDAAHVHLPAGGQGMNVGVQDAANLAWKLAAELTGWAPPRLVDGAESYPAERLPVIDRLLADTRAQSVLMNTFTPAGQAIRDWVSGLIERDGDTADTLRGQLSGLGVGYPTQTTSDRPDLAGCRVPDLALRSDTPLRGRSTLHRALRPDGYLLVALDPAVDVPDTGDDRVTPARAHRAWSGAGAVLVRPDGHAAAAWSVDGARNAAAVRSEIAGWTGPGAASAAA